MTSVSDSSQEAVDTAILGHWLIATFTGRPTSYPLSVEGTFMPSVASVAHVDFVVDAISRLQRLDREMARVP
jgi:hypothetical protein